MSKAAKLRVIYADRKSRHVCVECEAPTGGTVRCIDCRTRQAERTARYNREHPETTAAAVKRRYWQNPEKHRAQKRQLRLAKKLRGECLKCSELAADGSNHCAKHTEIERIRARDYVTRKRNGGPLKKGGRPPGGGRTSVRSFCECGTEKAASARMCDRCANLEGKGSPALVISALRGSDGMSLRELCRAVGMNDTLNNGTRQMWRWVKQLMAEGRIRRYWFEDVSTEEHAVFGNKTAPHAIGCWVYVLDGKTEREWRRAA